MVNVTGPRRPTNGASPDPHRWNLSICQGPSRCSHNWEKSFSQRVLKNAVKSSGRIFSESHEKPLNRSCRSQPQPMRFRRLEVFATPSAPASGAPNCHHIQSTATHRLGDPGRGVFVARPCGNGRTVAATNRTTRTFFLDTSQRIFLTSPHPAPSHGGVRPASLERWGGTRWPVRVDAMRTGTKGASPATPSGRSVGTAAGTTLPRRGAQGRSLQTPRAGRRMVPAAAVTSPVCSNSKHTHRAVDAVKRPAFRAPRFSKGLECEG